MILDADNTQVVSPTTRNAAHYRLMIDRDGTGLHRAVLGPLALAEHEHDAVQVSVLLDGLAAVTRAWGCGLTRRAQERRLGAGGAYIVPSGQVHAFTADSAGVLMNFYLSPAFLEESLAGRRPRLPGLTVTDDPVIRHLASSLQRAYLEWDGVDHLLVETAANILASRLDDAGTTHGDVAAERLGRLPMGRLRAVLDFIEAHHDEAITIAQVARVAGYSAVHFTRLFRASTGSSPRRFIIRQRLAHAMALLRSTETPVVDVALRVGFNSHAHFSTQFRQVFGVTPQTYRRAGRH